MEKNLNLIDDEEYTVIDLLLSDYNNHLEIFMYDTHGDQRVSMYLSPSQILELKNFLNQLT